MSEMEKKQKYYCSGINYIGKLKKHKKLLK